MHNYAAVIGAGTSDPKVIRHADQAMRHARNAEEAHNAGDYVGASAHLSEAAMHLQNAATTHTGKLNRDDVASPELLDIAHLGKAQDIHQSYVDEINEGKNNGR